MKDGFIFTSEIQKDRVTVRTKGTTAVELECYFCAVQDEREIQCTGRDLAESAASKAPTCCLCLDGPAQLGLFLMESCADIIALKKSTNEQA